MTLPRTTQKATRPMLRIDQRTAMNPLSDGLRLERPLVEVTNLMTATSSIPDSRPDRPCSNRHRSPTAPIQGSLDRRPARTDRRRPLHRALKRGSRPVFVVTGRHDRHRHGRWNGRSGDPFGLRRAISVPRRASGRSDSSPTSSGGTIRTWQCVDSHTEGMPTRVVGGVGVLPGSTMEELRRYVIEQADDLRMRPLEPHGHAAMSGAIVQPPTRPDADWGVVYIEVSGCLPCVVTTTGRRRFSWKRAWSRPNLRP